MSDSLLFPRLGSPPQGFLPGLFVLIAVKEEAAKTTFRLVRGISVRGFHRVRAAEQSLKRHPLSLPGEFLGQTALTIDKPWLDLNRGVVYTR